MKRSSHPPLLGVDRLSMDEDSFMANGSVSELSQSTSHSIGSRRRKGTNESAATFSDLSARTRSDGRGRGRSRDFSPLKHDEQLRPLRFKSNSTHSRGFSPLIGTSATITTTEDGNPSPMSSPWARHKKRAGAILSVASSVADGSIAKDSGDCHLSLYEGLSPLTPCPQMVADMQWEFLSQAKQQHQQQQQQQQRQPQLEIISSTASPTIDTLYMEMIQLTKAKSSGNGDDGEEENAADASGAADSNKDVGAGGDDEVETDALAVTAERQPSTEASAAAKRSSCSERARGRGRCGGGASPVVSGANTPTFSRCSPATTLTSTPAAALTPRAQISPLPSREKQQKRSSRSSTMQKSRAEPEDTEVQVVVRVRPPSHPTRAASTVASKRKRMPLRCLTTVDSEHGVVVCLGASEVTDSGDKRKSKSNSTGQQPLSPSVIRTPPTDVASTREHTFTFDTVFDQDAMQVDIMAAIGARVVDRVLDGYHGTLLCYGQSGCGKTHTMIGPGGGQLSKDCVLLQQEGGGGEEEEEAVAGEGEEATEKRGQNIDATATSKWRQQFAREEGVEGDENENDDNDEEEEEDDNDASVFTEEVGLASRMLYRLFRKLEKSGNLDVAVSIGAVELYNEELRDLLPCSTLTKRPKRGALAAISSPTPPATASDAAFSSLVPALRIRDGPPPPDSSGSVAMNVSVYVEGLRFHTIRNFKEAMLALRLALRERSLGATKLNITSSRAHTLFFTHVKQSQTASGTGDVRTVSKHAVLTLVDLAGSERVGHTGAEGLRLKEAQQINLSLSHLGNVIRRLTSSSPQQQQQQHIPYRDSKLTRLLTDSFGGSAVTVLLCNISPDGVDSGETMSTLRFAKMAKLVKNHATMNMLTERTEKNAAVVATLKAEAQTYQDQLQSAQKYVEWLESQLDAFAKQQQQQPLCEVVELSALPRKSVGIDASTSVTTLEVEGNEVHLEGELRASMSTMLPSGNETHKDDPRHSGEDIEQDDNQVDTDGVVAVKTLRSSSNNNGDNDDKEKEKDAAEEEKDKAAVALSATNPSFLNTIEISFGETMTTEVLDTNTMANERTAAAAATTTTTTSALAEKIKAYLQYQRATDVSSEVDSFVFLAELLKKVDERDCVVAQMSADLAYHKRQLQHLKDHQQQQQEALLFASSYNQRDEEDSITALLAEYGGDYPRNSTVHTSGQKDTHSGGDVDASAAACQQQQQRDTIHTKEPTTATPATINGDDRLDGEAEEDEEAAMRVDGQKLSRVESGMEDTDDDDAVSSALQQIEIYKEGHQQRNNFTSNGGSDEVFTDDEDFGYGGAKAYRSETVDDQCEDREDAPLDYHEDDENDSDNNNSGRSTMDGERAVSPRRMSDSPMPQHIIDSPPLFTSTSSLSGRVAKTTRSSSSATSRSPSRLGPFFDDVARANRSYYQRDRYGKGGAILSLFDNFSGRVPENEA